MLLAKTFSFIIQNENFVWERKFEVRKKRMHKMLKYLVIN